MGTSSFLNYLRHQHLGLPLTKKRCHTRSQKRNTSIQATQIYTNVNNEQNQSLTSHMLLESAF